MGYLIESGFTIKKIVVPEADFLTCGTLPVILIQGVPNEVFQLINVVATAVGGYTSLSPYVIQTSITGTEIAATHFDNLQTSGVYATYSIGVNPSTDNFQKPGSKLQITIRSGIDPVPTSGGGDVTFYLIYKSLFV